MKRVSFTQVKAQHETELLNLYLKFEAFSYLIEDRNVKVTHLESIRQEMQISIEDFAEACDKALTQEINPYGNDENPYGLLLDGNRRKPKMEVER